MLIDLPSHTLLSSPGRKATYDIGLISVPVARKKNMCDAWLVEKLHYFAQNVQNL